ncbi:pyrophosphatase PpaX [Paenibacillus lentus]|uniref:Pyrophosphatase PpaX n=1 Tax=Paenibacillus lentus TaxID=1338368 RepID=A0A3S8RRI4_9BACL|nr:pyrophosphatase PpaX [Paenibacillus lentus]AZK45457.1 pyrophosphatase PpaX [Paenibacillus lentus]
MKIDTVLFDLDGTIIDTNELIIASFQHVLDKHKQPRTREQIIPYMGMTLEQQFQAFSGWQDVSELVTDYRSFNTIHHDTMVKGFPHVDEVISTLKDRGIKLGIVTTKIRPSTMRVLELFGLVKYMDTIVTVQDVTHPKPHPEPVLKAMEQLNADPKRTIMIGDSPADIKSAQAAGALSAAVAWSLKGAEELKKYNPDYILEDMLDLYGVLGWELQKK